MATGSHTSPGQVREEVQSTRAPQTPPRQTGRSTGHSECEVHVMQRRRTAEQVLPAGQSVEVTHTGPASGASTAVASGESTASETSIAEASIAEASIAEASIAEASMSMVPSGATTTSIGATASITSATLVTSGDATMSEPSSVETGVSAVLVPASAP